jgi:hypothetical protein
MKPMIAKAAGKSQFNADVKRVTKPGDKIIWVLVVMSVLGFVLRVFGADWGRPLQLHPDEPAIMSQVDRVLMGEPPSFFGWPGHVNIFATAGIVFLLEATSLEVDRYVVGRVLTAFVSSAGAFLAYFFLKRFDRIAAFAGFSFVTFSPLLIQHSHYVTTDVWLATAFIAWIYISGLVLANINPRLSSSTLGAVAAVSIAVKFPGAVLAPLGVAILWLSFKGSQFRALVGRYLIAFAVSFFVFGFFLVANSNQVLGRLINNSRDSHLGSDGKGYVEKVFFYGETFVSWHGLFITTLAIMGFIRVFWAPSDQRRLMVPLLLGPLFILAISVLGLHWERWGIPAFAVFLMFAGLGVMSIREIAENLMPNARVLTSGVTAILAATAILGSAINSGVTSSSFLLADTRETAYEWSKSRGISADNTAHESYSAVQPGWSPVGIADCLTIDDDGVLLPSCPGIKYAAVSSGMYGRILVATGYEAEKAIYRALEQQSELVFEVEAITPSYPTIAPWVPWSSEASRIMGQVQSSEASRGPTLKIYSLSPLP